MVAQLTKKNYTVAEYLALENQAENRNEFIDGEILPMAGGTTNHNELITNLCLLLKPTLRQRRNQFLTKNVRLSIPEHNIFTYPDMMVIEGETIYYGESKTTVTNPVIIIEVLSEDTRDYDQGGKFGYYRSLETLQEYVLIEPEKYLLMLYRKGTNKNWSLDILDNQNDILELKSVGLEINLYDLYEGVL